MAQSGKKRGGWIYKNLNNLRMKRAFWMKYIAFFMLFERLSFGEKIKDTSFNFVSQKYTVTTIKDYHTHIKHQDSKQSLFIASFT